MTSGTHKSIFKMHLTVYLTTQEVMRERKKKLKHVIFSLALYESFEILVMSLNVYILADNYWSLILSFIQLFPLKKTEILL